MEKEREINLRKAKEMENEIKKIREMSVFKASGIRKFKGLDASKVPEKSLTVP
jgi:hypothetical protein